MAELTAVLDRKGGNSFCPGERGMSGKEPRPFQATCNLQSFAMRQASGGLADVQRPRRGSLRSIRKLLGRQDLFGRSGQGCCLVGAYPGFFAGISLLAAVFSREKSARILRQMLFGSHLSRATYSLALALLQIASRKSCSCGGISGRMVLLLFCTGPCSGLSSISDVCGFRALPFRIQRNEVA